VASGKPVVGTRAGGIPELIAHGTTGFLVKRGGIAEMAERILELLRDAGLRGRMGQAGRDVALEKFDHKKNVARLMDFYFPA
jgi:glycosyltransferase involved in cell wall biosynthesis